MSTQIGYIEERPRTTGGESSYRVVWRHRYTKVRYRPTMPTLRIAQFAWAKVNECLGDITAAELDQFILTSASIGTQADPKNHAEAKPTSPMAPTFEQWAKEWVANKLNVGDETRKGYALILDDRPAKAFGKIRLPEISDEMVARLFAKMTHEPSPATGRPVQPATVHRLHAVLAECFAYAIPRWISANPCSSIDKSKHQNLPSIKPYESCFLTDKEVRRIIENSLPASADLIDILSVTGMRLGEAIKLQCQHVSLPSVAIGPLPQGEGEPAVYVAEAKSDAGVRVITISRRSAEVLRPRIENHKPTDLVFTSPKGKPWDEHNFRDRYWLKALAGASRCSDHMPPLKVYKRGPDHLDPLSVSTCACPARLQKSPRIHDLRHSHVQGLIDQGWDWDQIRARVGHEKVTTTITLYAKRRRQGNAAALDAIDPMRVGG